MRSISITAVTLLATALAVDGFTASTLPSTRDSLTAVSAYVPDGLTAAQYKKIKDAEAIKAKNLGNLGPRGFKSRSFQSFQEALEKGEAGHLMPVFNAKEKIKSGELRKEDIPYMQRGGSWDNSDVKGAKKGKWLSSDKEYANGGYQREQSASIFGYGAGLDWTGKQARSGPESNMKPIKFKKGYKAPNVKDFKSKSDDEKPKKKFFGMF